MHCPMELIIIQNGPAQPITVHSTQDLKVAMAVTGVNQVYLGDGSNAFPHNA